MSYETKAGVAVSCSFLCLVGVVLSSKLWEGQAANAGTPAGELEKKETAGGPPTGGVGADANIPKLKTPPDDIQLVKGTGGTPPRDKVAELFGEGDDPFQGTPYKQADAQNNSAPPPTIPVAQINSSTPIVPRIKPPDSPPVAQTPTPSAPIIPSGSDNSWDEILQGRGPVNTNAAAQKGAAGPGNGAAPKVPDMSGPSGSALDKLYADEEKKKREAAAVSALAAAANPVKTVTDGSDNIAKQLAKQQQLAQAGNGPGNPIKDSAVDASLTGAGAGGIGGASGTPVQIPGMNADANQLRRPTDQYTAQPNQQDLGTGQRGGAPVSLGSPMPPPANQYAQLRNPPANSFHAEPPPIGARPESAIQPVNVTLPTSAAPAQKDHWDDDLYQAHAGDTYEAIARNYYHSDSYAQALKFYNRDHLLATPATRKNPDTILDGQQVFEPPLRILKRDYSSVIPDQTDGASARSAATQPTAAPPTSPAVAALPEKRMRVRGGGEVFLTIARTRLGDENRWAEIYRLNPSFDPSYPIPGGTIIRMPGDAKIDPADAVAQ